LPGPRSIRWCRQIFDKSLLVARLEVLIIVLFIIHLVCVNLIGSFLVVDGLAACASSAANDVLGRDGFEIAVTIVVLIWE
jgi:hypothetical protein